LRSGRTKRKEATKRPDAEIGSFKKQGSDGIEKEIWYVEFPSPRGAGGRRTFEARDEDYPNLIYPCQGSIFVHIFKTRDMDELEYRVIEPKLDEDEKIKWEDEKIKWYLRPIFVLGPFGLPFLYRSPHFSKGLKIILTIAVIIYTLYVIFALLEIGKRLFNLMEELQSTLGQMG
jgi:hypothetical protein